MGMTGVHLGTNRSVFAGKSEGRRKSRKNGLTKVEPNFEAISIGYGEWKFLSEIAVWQLRGNYCGAKFSAPVFNLCTYLMRCGVD